VCRLLRKPTRLAQAKAHRCHRAPNISHCFRRGTAKNPVERRVGQPPSIEEGHRLRERLPDIDIPELLVFQLHPKLYGQATKEQANPDHGTWEQTGERKNEHMRDRQVWNIKISAFAGQQAFPSSPSYIAYTGKPYAMCARERARAAPCACSHLVTRRAVKRAKKCRPPNPLAVDDGVLAGLFRGCRGRQVVSEAAQLRQRFRRAGSGLRQQPKQTFG